MNSRGSPQPGPSSYRAAAVPRDVKVALNSRRIVINDGILKGLQDKNNFGTHLRTNIMSVLLDTTSGHFAPANDHVSIMKRLSDGKILFLFLEDFFAANGLFLSASVLREECGLDDFQDRAHRLATYFKGFTYEQDHHKRRIPVLANIVASLMEGLVNETCPIDFGQ